MPLEMSPELRALLAQRALQQAFGVRPVASHRPESEFQSWYEDMARRYDLNPNPDDPQQFYDYRSAFKAGASPDATGHWPSTFKKPGHPNMVVGGFNVQTGERVAGTEQATEAELIRLGWDADFARTHGRKPGGR